MDLRIQLTEEKSDLLENLLPLLKSLEGLLAISSSELNAAETLKLEIGEMKASLQALSQSLATERTQARELNRSLAQSEESAKASISVLVTKLTELHHSLAKLTLTSTDLTKKLAESRQPQSTRPK